MKNPVRHKIGSARTIRTTILAVEYLRAQCLPNDVIHKDLIRFVFEEPTAVNGFWCSHIIVDEYTVEGKYNKEFDQALSRLVDLCRAFVAGAGEIWA